MNDKVVISENILKKLLQRVDELAREGTLHLDADFLQLLLKQLGVPTPQTH